MRGFSVERESLEERFVALTGEGSTLPNSASDAGSFPSASSVPEISSGSDASSGSGLGSTPGAPSSLSLLASELKTLFRRRRTAAMLVALAAIPVLIAVAVRLSSTVPPGRGPAFLDRISQNGLFVAVTAMLVSVPLFLPLTIGVVAGDTIAGEASLGTLRYLLVAPAGRVRLLLVKYAGTLAFCLAAPVTVALAGAAVGASLFPVGPVTLLSGDVVQPLRPRCGWS
ncbi:conserved hypothetical protein [Arthrobacter sp. Hiyo4]|nr:conserved hypothetical protein [Arthrobacter sp. Hiyo4]